MYFLSCNHKLISDVTIQWYPLSESICLQEFQLNNFSSVLYDPVYRTICSLLKFPYYYPDFKGKRARLRNLINLSTLHSD